MQSSASTQSDGLSGCRPYCIRPVDVDRLYFITSLLIVGSVDSVLSSRETELSDLWGKVKKRYRSLHTYRQETRIFFAQQQRSSHRQKNKGVRFLRRFVICVRFGVFSRHVPIRCLLPISTAPAVVAFIPDCAQDSCGETLDVTRSTTVLAFQPKGEP